MYYLDSVTQQQVVDSLVPFVRTISDVARDVDRTYHEIDLGIRMPELLGTNAYFFPDFDVPVYRQNYVHLNVLPNHQRIGYIVGGIASTDLNIADIDPSSMSSASSRVFEVFVDRSDTVSGMREVSNNVLNFFCRPNPATNSISVDFELTKATMAKLELLDLKGASARLVCNQNLSEGKHQQAVDISSLPSGIYNCVLTVDNNRKAIRLVKE